jgi:hypothetical protein
LKNVYKTLKACANMYLRHACKQGTTTRLVSSACQHVTLTFCYFYAFLALGEWLWCDNFYPSHNSKAAITKCKFAESQRKNQSLLWKNKSCPTLLSYGKDFIFMSTVWSYFICLFIWLYCLFNESGNNSVYIIVFICTTFIIYCVLDDTADRWDYGRFSSKQNIGWIWKEAVMTWFEVRSWNFSGKGNEENHEILQSG